MQFVEGDEELLVSQKATQWTVSGTDVYTQLSE